MSTGSVVVSANFLRFVSKAGLEMSFRAVDLSFFVVLFLIYRVIRGCWWAGWLDGQPGGWVINRLQVKHYDD